MALKIQAREIVRAAKRFNRKLTRGVGTITPGIACAAGIVALSRNMSYFDMQCGSNCTDDIKGLEAGFEGLGYRSDSSAIFRRYHKIGQRVAKMAGLPVNPD